MLKRSRKRISILLFLTFMFSLFTFHPSKVVAASGNTYEAQMRTSGAVVLFIGSPVAYVTNVKKNIDSENKNITPIVKNERTLVPVRFIAENFGAKVGWEDSTSRITISSKDNLVKLKIGDDKITVNNVESRLDVAAESINDRTYIPLRALAESLGKKVFFDRGLIIISDKDNIVDTTKEKDLVDEIISWFTGNSVKDTTSNDSKLSLKEIALMDKSVVEVTSLNSTGKILGLGSAFCIGEGLFLTNNHVVQNGKKFYITSSDEKKYEVEGIVKFDYDKDIAILKTKDKTDITPMEIGSKDMVSKGDEIVAIGNPIGLQNTISEGIVSGFRTSNGVDFIQHTAPITFGSSGGPLINLQGKVIGINSAGYSTGNLNFAIAIDHAKDWINELKSKPFENISVLNIDDELAKAKVDAKAEAVNEINKLFKAYNEEDLTTSLALRTRNVDKDKLAATLTEQFKKYDLNYELIRVDFTMVGQELGYMDVTYTIKRKGGEDFRDIRVCENYVFQKQDGKWMLGNTGDKGVKYLDEQTVDVGSKVETADFDGSNFNFNITDTAINSSKPIVYMVDKENKKLYAFNYDTNKLESMTFNYAPQSVTFANGELYVSILTQNANSSGNIYQQEGAVAIIDADSFALRDQFKVYIDPYDIAVDKDGVIYVSSASGQRARIKSYSRQTKQEIDSIYSDDKVRLMYSEAYNKLYTISGSTHYSYDISQGSFLGKIEGNREPIENLTIDHPSNSWYSMISPDGKYIFNVAGNVLVCDSNKANDMKYYKKIDRGFNNIAFDLNNNRFFYSDYNDRNVIHEYDYTTFTEVKTYNLKNDERNILLYFNNKLITLSEVGTNKYSLEIIDVSK